MQFQIFICSFHRSGAFRNGSHRSSNGFKYSYTEFDTTTIYSSLPLSLLRESILAPIKQFFSRYKNSEKRIRDWEPGEYEINEEEIDLTLLLETLNKNNNPCYSNYVFLQGNKDICPYPHDFIIQSEYEEIDYTD